MARLAAANTLADFAVKVLDAAGEVGCICLLEFPEDLGPSKLGTPASLWQRADMRALTKHGFQRGALYQSDWGTGQLSKTHGLDQHGQRFV